MAIRHPRRLLAACTLFALAALPAAAARPVHRHVAPVSEGASVAVHRGTGGGEAGRRPAGPAWGGGYAPIGYWEADYGREDDAAIFAARYGCARPIWNAKSNRYIAACN